MFNFTLSNKATQERYWPKRRGMQRLREEVVGKHTVELVLLSGSLGVRSPSLMSSKEGARSYAASGQSTLVPQPFRGPLPPKLDATRQLGCLARAQLEPRPNVSCSLWLHVNLQQTPTPNKLPTIPPQKTSRSEREFASLHSIFYF